MQNLPPQAALKRIPKLYSTDSLPLADKIIYLHFFIGGCDWYVAEYDGDDLFFGFANLNDDWNAEWGLIPYSELKGARTNAAILDHATGEQIGSLPIEVEWDEYWQVRPFVEIKEQQR